MLALDLGDVTHEEAAEAWKGFDVEDNDDMQTDRNFMADHLFAKYF